MLDVALLMANASQLKAVLEQGPNTSFYTPIITLISISLCLQVAVGILLIFIGEKINIAHFCLSPQVRLSTDRPLFHPVHLASQYESIVSSPLTPNKQCNPACWTLAVTTATRPDIRSEVTRF